MASTRAGVVARQRLGAQWQENTRSNVNHVALRKKPGEQGGVCGAAWDPMMLESLPHARAGGCPWLPGIAADWDRGVARRHGAERGAAFYRDALVYAQAMWLADKPAQAILQLNKAWMAELPAAAPVLECHPPPYAALVWILHEAVDGSHGYLGNPVRHFQHLASRVSGPRAEIRSWRAWWCFHLAEIVLPHDRFPRDGKQCAREGLWIPSHRTTLAHIARHGWADEFTHAHRSADSVAQ
jgi:hypothetical protein